MAIRDIFKVNRKTFLDPGAWINVDLLADQTNSLKTVLKNTFTAAPPGVPETFEAAMKRQGLTEKDISEGMATYRALAIVFALLGVGCLGYAVVLIFKHGSFLGMMLGFAVSGLFFAQAFRYDFWSFQMRKRQLGLTYEDWKKNYLGK